MKPNRSVAARIARTQLRPVGRRTARDLDVEVLVGERRAGAELLGAPRATADVRGRRAFGSVWRPVDPLRAERLGLRRVAEAQRVVVVSRRRAERMGRVCRDEVFAARGSVEEARRTTPPRPAVSVRLALGWLIQARIAEVPFVVEDLDVDLPHAAGQESRKRERGHKGSTVGRNCSGRGHTMRHAWPGP